MKKLPLVLIAILILSVSAYFVSCKKETDSPPPQELPAVQKIRVAAAKQWEIAENSLLELTGIFDQKLKADFADFETDTTVLVTCRVKFKDDDVEHILPYTQKFLGGVKYYFYTFNSGKPSILFYNSAVDDFNVAGTGSAASVEQISFNFTKIDW